MLKVHVLDKKGKRISEISVPKEIFGYPYKEHLLYEAVVNFRANQRQGTASTKTRGEVSGSGRKLWKQKGTGRARVGSIRSPLWKKGGTVFGPKPRDYSYRLPKNVKRNALKSALSRKLADKQMLVLEAVDIKEPKTKEGVKFLEALKLDSALIVDYHQNRNLFLSLQNVPRVKAVDYNQVNIYDVLNYKWLVFSQKAFESFMERLK
jgi:large subunit ribosomal protein L4